MKKKLLCLLMASLLLFQTIPCDVSASNSTKTTSIARAKNTLEIVKQPKSVTVSKGKTAKVTVVVNGDSVKYEWYYKNIGAKSFKKTNTFNGNSYSADMTPSRNGRQIYCKITDKYGNSVKTKTVTLHMGNALKITKQPISSSAYKGDNLKITVTASGDGLKYEWYYKNANSKSFKKTNTFKSNFYSADMTATRNGRQIYCKITDKYGNSIKTKTVTLHMRNALKITKQPVSVAAYNGDTAKVTIAASGDKLSYTWYYKNADANSFKKTDTFKGNSYYVDMTSARNGRQIYCKITDKYGTSVNTNVVTLSTKTPLKITTQPKSVCVLSGETANISFVATGDSLKYE